MITKVVAEVVRNRSTENPIECTVEYIVNTRDTRYAVHYVEKRLAEGGWEIISITAHTTWLHEVDINLEDDDNVENKNS